MSSEAQSAGLGKARPSSPKIPDTAPPAIPVQLSVVAIEWRSRGLLKHAIASVISQGHPAEIVVVKNKADPELDSWLTSHGVLVLHTKDESIGGKYALGFQRATGEVILPLEDDDVFLSDKLRFLSELFGKDPELDLVHHGHVRRNPSSGALTPGPFIPDFNCSSMALRRSVALLLIPSLLRESGTPDTLIYYGTEALGKQTLQIPERFTEVRLDPLAPSHGPLLSAYLRTAREVQLLGRGRSRRKALSTVTATYFSYLMRSRLPEGQGRAAWALVSLLKDIDIRSMLPNLREVVCGAIYPFAPPLSRLAYRMARQGQIDWVDSSDGRS